MIDYRAGYPTIFWPAIGRNVFSDYSAEDCDFDCVYDTLRKEIRHNRANHRMRLEDIRELSSLARFRANVLRERAYERFVKIGEGREDWNSLSPVIQSVVNSLYKRTDYILAIKLIRETMNWSLIRSKKAFDFFRYEVAGETRPN